MKQEKGWIVYPLEDKSVNELVLPRGHVADLRKLSKKQSEFTGLLYGVPRDESLYLIGYLILGRGGRVGCTFDNKYLKFYNEFMKRTKQLQPNLTSTLYHNHPLLSSDEYPIKTVKQLEQEINEGIFDYLWDYGIEPILRRAIEEQSRQLSDSDIESTFGRLHVLITDTERNGKDFSHINAYKFDPNSLVGAELFRVVPLSDKPDDVRAWVGGICSSIKKVYEDIKNEY